MLSKFMHIVFAGDSKKKLEFLHKTLSSLISRDNMIKHRNIVGSRPSFYKLNDFEAVDVDFPIDFEFAEFSLAISQLNLLESPQNQNTHFL